MSASKREPSKLFKLKPTYKWAPDSGDKFIMALNSPDLMNDMSIHDQKQYVSTRGDVNKATDEINMIFHKAAVKADLMKQKRKPVKRQNTEKWFDQECKTIRKDLRKIANEKHCHPNSPALRTRYSEILMKYKCAIRNQKLNNTHMPLEDIENAIKINSGTCGTT